MSSIGLVRKEWVERQKIAWWSRIVILVDTLSEAKINKTHNYIETLFFKFHLTSCSFEFHLNVYADVFIRA